MEDFNSKYTGQQVEDILDSVNGKQDLIEDLDAIREGASKGATALQSIPSEYVTESDLNKKVDKVTGKGLSTEDFTTALKNKLEGLSNYDDTQIENAVSSLQTQLNTLVSGNASGAIESFNEIIAFLDGIADSEDLNSIIASIEQQIATKANTDSLAKVATSGSYNDLKNQPTIPSAVTESTVSGWGFTKNTGTYSKPNSGIPMDDLDTYVQNILDKVATKEEYAGIDDIVQLRGFESSLGGCVYALPDEANGAEDDIVATKNSLKTINGESIVGSGDINMPYYESGGYTYVQKGISDDDLIYALPTSAGGAEDDVLVTVKTLKTINGQSLIGSGDITISGGGGSSAYSEVSHGTSDTTFALTPNTFHIWDEVSSLTLTLGAETSGVANEYLFQFTSGSEPTTLSLPDDIKWTGGDAPTIEANKIYQVSILKGLGSVLEWDNSNIGTFTINYGQSSTVDFNFDKGMTWQDFVGSEYNTDSAITIYNSRVVYLNSFSINDVSPTDAIINMNIYLATYWD